MPSGLLFRPAMNARDHGLRSLLAEGIIVLLSVLGAFTLEGWRIDREVAREVRQELASVQGELQRNRDGVLVEIVTLQRVVAGGEALIEAIDATPTGSMLTIPDTLLFLGATWHPSYNASLGAVEALLASGRLSEIDDPDLRLGLAGLDEAIADAVEEEEFARSTSVEHLNRELSDVLDWPSYDAVFTDFFGARGEGDSPQARAASLPIPHAGTVELPATRRIRNLVRARVQWQRAAIGEFRRLERRLDELLALLDGELG